MKIIDINGNPIENPDLSLGWLEEKTETIHHDAVQAVAEVWHHETATLPDGSPAIYYDENGKEKGRDVVKVVDVPGVEAKDAWAEEVQMQVYHLYTADELAAQEQARKEAEEKAQLPTVEERLAVAEAAIADIGAMLAAQA